MQIDFKIKEMAEIVFLCQGSRDSLHQVLYYFIAQCNGLRNDEVNSHMKTRNLIQFGHAGVYT